MVGNKPERRKTSEIKRAENRRRLLDAAFGLFLEYGAERTTVEQIASRAGLAKGTFYLYFRGKGELIEKLVQMGADKLLADAWERCYPPKDECDGIELMRRVAEEVIDALSRDKRLIGFIHGNLSFELFSKITANPTGSAPVNMLDTIIERLNLGGIQPREPRIAIFLAVEMFVGACYQSILFEYPLPMPALKPYLFTAVQGIVSSL